MRVGDFGVEVLAVQGNDIREADSGHVLARPGAVYALRLRNFGPLRCVAQVEIDGKAITAGGLVLDAYDVCTLERPIDHTETGRFTVVAEGDERVFGPDGGRDNADLGLIEARFRRELPNASRHRATPRSLPASTPLFPRVDVPRPGEPAPGRPMAPPEWTPPSWESKVRESPPDRSAIASFQPSRTKPQPPADAIERAAGTGLTGHSTQEFVSVVVGALEAEATVVRLRLVIGTEEALSAPRPLPSEEAMTPARPAARP